jgi:hypothetical protein
MTQTRSFRPPPLGRSLALWLVAAVGAPLALGAALLPAETALGDPAITLALVVPVVVVAAAGRRIPAAVAAVSGALTFDVLYTAPRGSLRIVDAADLVATVVLLAVGIIVAEVATWGRRQAATANRTVTDISALRSLAELMARGEDEQIVLITAAFWLRDLLHLRDCSFERNLEPASPATVGAGGEVVMGDLRWSAETQGLPGPLDLLLQADGRTFGRFVMEPTPALPVSPDSLFTAAALADMLGSWLGPRGGGGPDPVDRPWSNHG